MIYLVRHGESEWNVRRLTQGQIAHPALTETGRAQARAAAALIAADLRAAAGPAPGASGAPALREIVTSDLVRAEQTARVLAGVLGAPVRTDPRLREQHLGTLQGRGYEETWAAAAEHDWSDPELPVAGGESPAQVRRRAAAALTDALSDSLDDALADSLNPTALVTHGDTLRALLAHLDDVEPQHAPWVEVPNGAVFATTGRGWRRLG